MTIMQKLLVVVVSLALLLLLTSHTEARRRLNCRLQVFHPRCRGASAKRSGGDFYPQDDVLPRLRDGGDEPADYPPLYSSEEADLPSRKRLEWSDSGPQDIPNSQAINLVKLLMRLKAALHQRSLSSSNRQPYDSDPEEF